ncbi:AraC family transcriptional regulator [Paenibacillus chondroitinus]|uniref:AraC family transcriptional regulator n=1 Tax=Paenibacillus chondroitinus TaxID=59842 RepID=A0ABU6D9M5_9BACL|nr:MULTISPECIES: AraC family transcriptional regulator [Paenibacillus]MCY9656794.1 AraC family transcriptional regulator [Paenibacillus anseongense]MEB4794444.1 AraC family transcriptional regulator [Paenibacillus chondroitinus]
MTRFLDYMISPQPIRIVDLKIESSKLSIPSLTIKGMGHLPGRTLQRSQAAFDSWAFLYIAGGSGFYRLNQGPLQQVEKGCLFFVFPGCVVDFGPEEGGHWDEYYVRFEGNRIQEWLGSWLVQTDIVKRVGFEEAWIAQLDAMFLLLESGSPTQIDQAALQLEALLFNWMARSKLPQGQAATSKAVDVLQDIATSLYTPLNAEQLAHRHHMAVSTLRRLVSQHTGYPLHDYIHRLKMEETKRLLLSTDLPIKEIADALGYPDESYFSRLFKKYGGLAPNHYRKRS